MATKVKAAQLMVYRAALKKDEYQAGAKVSYSVEAAMAKLYAAEVAMEVTTKCVQLHGGYGYIREYDVEHCCSVKSSVRIELYSTCCIRYLFNTNNNLHDCFPPYLSNAHNHEPG